MNIPRDDVFAATAADSAMVVPVMALINTLALFSPNTTLAVLSVKLTEAEVSRLCQFATRLGLRLRMLTFNSDIVQHTVLRSPHLSRVAYARLFLPELLPELDRVIWLDTDTLVLESLTSLWQIEMEDSLVAAVPDDFIQKEEISDTGSQLGQYFNSGVMVMNLALWRAEQLMPRVRELILSPNLICEDQSVINMICLNRVCLLNRKWNFFTRRFTEYPSTSRCISPAILHFAATPKPWVDRTAFGQLFLRQLPVDVRKKVCFGFAKVSVTRRLDLAQRRIFGLLSGKRKHWIAVDLKIAELKLIWRFYFRKWRIRKNPM